LSCCRWLQRLVMAVGRSGLVADSFAQACCSDGDVSGCVCMVSVLVAWSSHSDDANSNFGS
jgi:hypothetical protein